MERLKKRREFLRVAAARQKWVAPGLILQACTQRSPSSAAGSQGSVRYGLTVSRKVGDAVARNRARRRLREAARLVLPEHARAGFDYVLIGRSATLTRPFRDLVGDLETAVRRVTEDRERTRERRKDNRP